MYQPPNQMYAQQPDGNWVTTQPQPPHQQQHQQQQQQQQSLPPIQHMAGPRMLPGMHGMNGMNGQNGYPTPYMPQQYYGGAYPPAQMPPQLPPQMLQEVQPERSARPMALTHSGRNDNYEFTLVVEQQPQRARMCGFGDKDRRPITPPPCVRLIIRDFSGREVDADSVNGSFFVLQVDLWNEKADREANVVRASNTASPSASISTATTTSFPPIPDRASMGGLMHGAYGMPNMPYGYPSAVPIPAPQSNNNMFTRNLIGSLTVNAAKLNDEKGKPGYWFVLQDLSVRTEGWFRLRMNFIDVGIMMPSESGPKLNKGRAPVLAHVFSNSFQVFSAKKFPGVIESTELSKTFAKQGVKIPIRKDTKDGKDDSD